MVVGGPSPESQALEGQVWGKEAKRFLWSLVESGGGGVLGTEALRVWHSGGMPTWGGHLSIRLWVGTCSQSRGTQRDRARARLCLERK